MNMKRGSTPTITITLGFDASLLDVFYLTFAQLQKVVLEKSLTEAIKSGESLIFELSQEDTLALSASTGVEMQGRGRAGTKTVETDILETTVERILKDGVI